MNEVKLSDDIYDPVSGVELQSESSTGINTYVWIGLIALGIWYFLAKGKR